jgi:steroid delta-isomerase-like uncharacterized protein
VSTEANKTVARRYFEEVRNRGDLGAIDDLFAPGFVLRVGGLPDVRGSDGLRQSYGAFRAALPDLRFTVEDVIAEGDRVVVRWSARGTHQGPLLGVAATGRPVAITGIDVFRIDGGKIAEGWSNFDQLGLLRQVGAVPAPR